MIKKILFVFIFLYVDLICIEMILSRGLLSHAYSKHKTVFAN